MPGCVLDGSDGRECTENTVEKDNGEIESGTCAADRRTLRANAKISITTKKKTSESEVGAI